MMNPKLALLLLAFASTDLLAAEPRPITLEEVGDVVRMRRALAQMTEEKRVALIVDRIGEDGRFDLKLENQLLLSCAPGLARVFGKEVLVSKSVEHLRITLNSSAVTPDEIMKLLEPKLKDVHATFDSRWTLDSRPRSRMKKTEPNEAIERSRLLVTYPADAGSAPSNRLAHLER